MIHPQIPSSLISNIEKINWSYGVGKCNLCSHSGEVHFEHKIYPDFILPENRIYTQKMSSAVDGICLNCGHFQRFNRLNSHELGEYLKDYPDKSDTSTGLLSKQYDYTDSLDNARNEIIKQFVDTLHFKSKSIYIARPSSTNTINHLLKKYPHLHIFYAENNSLIRNDIDGKSRNREFVHERNYKVHGELQLDVSCNGYVIIHCLQHVIDLKSTIERICALISKGKEFLLLEEVNRKLHNPFHVNHFSEDFLVNLFKSKGVKTQRIESSVLESTYISGLQSSNNISGIRIYG